MQEAAIAIVEKYSPCQYHYKPLPLSEKDKEQRIMRGNIVYQPLPDNPREFKRHFKKEQMALEQTAKTELQEAFFNILQKYNKNV